MGVGGDSILINKKIKNKIKSSNRLRTGTGRDRSRLSPSRLHLAASLHRLGWLAHLGASVTSLWLNYKVYTNIDTIVSLVLGDMFVLVS